MKKPMQQEFKLLSFCGAVILWKTNNNDYYLRAYGVFCFHQRDHPQPELPLKFITKIRKSTEHEEEKIRWPKE